MDVSKLFVCQGTQHCVNLAIAWKIGVNSGLECEWYIINLISDALIGVLFQYLFLQLVMKSLKDTKYEFETGDYYVNHSFSFKEYFYQIFIWWFIVFISKFISLGIVLFFATYFQALGVFLLKGFKGNPKLKLVFVMIVIPVFFNTLQFWITDNFIQRHNLSEDDTPDAPEIKDYLNTLHTNHSCNMSLSKNNKDNENNTKNTKIDVNNVKKNIKLNNAVITSDKTNNSYSESYNNEINFKKDEDNVPLISS